MRINSVVYPSSCNLLMVLLSFELEVISNKSSSLVGEICELHIVLSHQRIFFYELLNFGKGAGNKKCGQLSHFRHKSSKQHYDTMRSITMNTAFIGK